MKTTQKDQSSTLVSFAVFGCLIHIMYSVIFSSAQDILSGTEIPTTTVLTANTVPPFFVELIASHFFKKIPHVVRVFIIVLNVFVGFLVMAYVNNVNWKIFGVAVASIGLAVGNISINSLSSYFTPAVMSSFSAGAGAGMFAGTFYYTALTTWICVSPNIALVVLSPLSILYFASFYVINRNKDQKYYLESATHEDVAYTRIEDKDADEDDEDTSDSEKKQPIRKFREDENLTRKEKLLVIAKLYSITVVPSFTAFFAQYLSTQSVVTTIAFKNASFRPRDHYQYYLFIFMFGELIGRSHRSVLSCVNLAWVYSPTRKLLWILSAMQTIILFFLIFESWYRFLPSVAIVLLVCLCAGVLIGCSFLNILELLHVTCEGSEREFMMRCGMFPTSGGMLAAAFVGLYVEPRLLKHCISTIPDSAYCFTRPDNLIDVTLRCRRI